MKLEDKNKYLKWSTNCARNADEDIMVHLLYNGEWPRHIQKMFDDVGGDFTSICNFNRRLRSEELDKALRELLDKTECEDMNEKQKQRVIKTLAKGITQKKLLDMQSLICPLIAEEEHL